MKRWDRSVTKGRTSSTFDPAKEEGVDATRAAIEVLLDAMPEAGDEEIARLVEDRFPGVFWSSAEDCSIRSFASPAQRSRRDRTRRPLESADAKTFLEAMPTPDRLIPAVTVDEIQKVLG
jgi:hypothetical protein